MPVTDVGGAVLEYDEKGNPDNPTIVFTHTILFGLEVFDHLASQLTDDYHLILLNLPGHGQSGYTADMTLEGITEDCFRLLTQLKLTKVTWFGHSMGGMIGMRMALGHPDMISSLVLITTTASADPPGLRLVTGQLWDLFRAGHREDIVDAALEYFLSPKTFSEQPELAAHVRDEVINMDNVDGLYTVAQAVLNRADITDEIAAIHVPTFVLAGKHDTGGAMPAESVLIATRISGAKLAIIDDASHMLILEKPKEVEALIHEFLAETKTLAST